MSDPRDARRRALAAEIASSEVDALLVSHLPNIRWLTGFTGSAGHLLVTAGGSAILVTDFRYEAQASEEVGESAEVVIDRVNVRERMRRVIEGLRIETLGFESHVVTVQEAERIRNLFKTQLVPLVEKVEALRQAKDLDEVAAIRAAAAVAHRALESILPTVRIGQTELAVAARLEEALRREGSEWHPFQTIVASGPRSALPHARSTPRELRRGDWLLIDFGARVQGYCSDITRTFLMGGSPDAQQREVYDLVAKAQRQARESIRPGMTGREADALARDVIAAGGFGEAFGHSLGHGVGLEVHEMPRLAATIDAPLPAGAVVTIEPGIYLPGWGGVRLEDDVWLSADGPVLLSNGRTELLTLDA